MLLHVYFGLYDLFVLCSFHGRGYPRLPSRSIITRGLSYCISTLRLLAMRTIVNVEYAICLIRHTGSVSTSVSTASSSFQSGCEHG